jgi:Tfp pilus assembly protein PilF
LGLLAIVAIVSSLAGCPTPRDPKKAQTRLELAKDLLAKGQDQAAEAEIKKAIAFDPRNEESHLVYGLIYVTRAARDVELMERKNCLEGAEKDALKEKVDEAMRRADEHFARATELAPDYGEAWMNRGVVAIHFGDWERAVEHLNQALAHAARLTSEALARTNLGWALYKNQDFTHATTELLQATQLVPNLCIAHYRLAQVYFDRERYEDALAQLQPFASGPGGEAPKCQPVLEALNLGGQASLRVNDIDGALPWFQRCVEVAEASCIARHCMKMLDGLGAGASP